MPTLNGTDTIMVGSSQVMVIYCVAHALYLTIGANNSYIFLQIIYFLKIFVLFILDTLYPSLFKNIILAEINRAIFSLQVHS